MKLMERQQKMMWVKFQFRRVGGRWQASQVRFDPSFVVKKMDYETLEDLLKGAEVLVRSMRSLALS